MNLAENIIHVGVRNMLEGDLNFYRDQIRSILAREEEAAHWSAEYSRGVVDVLTYAVEMLEITLGLYECTDGTLPNGQRLGIVVSKAFVRDVMKRERVKQHSSGASTPPELPKQNTTKGKS